MSKNSSATHEEIAELGALLDGPVGKLELDRRELAAALLSARARGEILAAANKAGVGVRELARRLGVSAAAVSRHLRSDGDMRLSTAALFADALGYEWRFALVPLAVPEQAQSNSGHRLVCINSLRFEVEEAPALPGTTREGGRRSGAQNSEELQQLAA
jgi:DNA-binding transcriptional ArsR family regulator